MVKPARLRWARSEWAACRLGAAMSQEQLARAVGVSYGFIGLLETGRRHASAPVVQRIADALQLPLDVLADVEDA